MTTDDRAIVGGSLSLSSGEPRSSFTEPSELSCARFDFVVCVVVIGTLSILGIGGNAASFLVLCRHRTETATVMLLRVLAVSDSVLLFSSLFVYSLPAVYPYTGTLKLFQSHGIVAIYVWPIALMAHTITVWITVLVTLHRYCSICRALQTSRVYAVRATRLQVIAVVSFSVLYNTPRFFEHQVIGETPGSYNSSLSNNTLDSLRMLDTPSRQVNLGDSRLYQIIYSNVLYFPVMYILPLTVLAFLNYRLMRAMNGLRERKQSLTGHRVKDDHVTLIVIVIVCVFLVSQTPALINQLFWALLLQPERRCGKFHFYYTKISDVLVVFNSSVNFIIYCLFGKTFRRIFIDAFCRKPAQVFSMTSARKDEFTRSLRAERSNNNGMADRQLIPTDVGDEPTHLLTVPNISPLSSSQVSQV